MTAAPADDDPFPEIIRHGGWNDREMEDIRELESVMRRFDLGTQEGPVILTMSITHAKRLRNAMEHAVDHGCDEGLRATWAWIKQVVLPALQARLGNIPDDEG